MSQRRTGLNIYEDAQVRLLLPGVETSEERLELITNLFGSDVDCDLSSNVTTSSQDQDATVMTVARLRQFVLRFHPEHVESLDAEYKKLVAEQRDDLSTKHFPRTDTGDVVCTALTRVGLNTLLARSTLSEKWGALLMGLLDKVVKRSQVLADQFQRDLEESDFFRRTYMSCKVRLMKFFHFSEKEVCFTFLLFFFFSMTTCAAN